MLLNFRGVAKAASDCMNRLGGCAGFPFDAKRASAFLLLLFLALGVGASFVSAQALDPAALLKPATDTWPTYNGDYSGKRFSTLDQINATNVGSLTLAWAFRTRGNTLKSTALEVNGILYFTAPDHVWA